MWAGICYIHALAPHVWEFQPISIYKRSTIVFSEQGFHLILKLRDINWDLLSQMESRLLILKIHPYLQIWPLPRTRSLLVRLAQPLRMWIVMGLGWVRADTMKSSSLLQACVILGEATTQNNCDSFSAGKVKTFSYQEDWSYHHFSEPLLACMCNTHASYRSYTAYIDIYLIIYNDHITAAIVSHIWRTLMPSRTWRLNLRQPCSKLSCWRVDRGPHQQLGRREHHLQLPKGPHLRLLPPKAVQPRPVEWPRPKQRPASTCPMC